MSRQFDFLTDHGIIVLSESERAEVLNMMQEALDARFEKGEDIQDGAAIYNKFSIGKGWDGTAEAHYNAERKRKGSHGSRKKKPRKRNG